MTKSIFRSNYFEIIVSFLKTYWHREKIQRYRWISHNNKIHFFCRCSIELSQINIQVHIMNHQTISPKQSFSVSERQFLLNIIGRHVLFDSLNTAKYYILHSKNRNVNWISRIKTKTRTYNRMHHLYTRLTFSLFRYVMFVHRTHKL